MDKKLKKQVYKAFGGILSMTGFTLTFIWYDWKLALILFLLIWGNNISINN